MATILAAIVLFSGLVIPALVHQASGLSDDVPRYLAGWESRTTGSATRCGRTHVSGIVVLVLIAHPQFENYVLVPRVMKAASIKVLVVEVRLRDRMAKGDRLARSA